MLRERVDVVMDVVVHVEGSACRNSRLAQKVMTGVFFNHA